MTKIREFVPLRILKQIYFAFIHSHLTYGIIAWGATYPSYLTPLKSLQIEQLNSFLAQLGFRVRIYSTKITIYLI